MPTYTVTTTPSHWTLAQKQSIASIITTTHAAEAGPVPPWLVQVIFHELPAGNHFINARPVPADQIWINGVIRAGRTDAQKTAICERVMREVAQALGIDGSFVWVYVSDLGRSAEFGRMLPEPGGEKEWLEGIPREVRERYGMF